MTHASFSRRRPVRHSFFALWLLAGGTAGARRAPIPAPAALITAATSRHMMAEIQVIPRPAGTADNLYKHVDAAIAVIQASGLRYKVHALGTVVEGSARQDLGAAAGRAPGQLDAGAERTLSIIKVSGAADPGGPRADDLVRKFRQ